MSRELKVGSHVIWIDSHRVEHDALVTRVWKALPGATSGHPSADGCNLVLVVKDEAQTDQYGRQIERQTSVCHISVQPARAFCWKWPDE